MGTMEVTERTGNESAREYALRVIQDNIVSLRLPPGALVSEKDLAKELGISRTPVREALIALSKSQIVEIYPQRGSYVSRIDYALIEEVRFLRLALEKAVVELACELPHGDRLADVQENLALQKFYLEKISFEKNAKEKLFELDNRFHRALFALCDKLSVYELLKSMTAHYDRLRSVTLRTIADVKIVEDHEAIVQAIERRDAQAASAAMSLHLSRFRTEQEELYQKHPEYFK